MSNHFYADGAIHKDHHKEITINGNMTEGQLQNVMKNFFADGEVIEESSAVDKESEDLCHFIHPTVNDEDERLRIHKEIQNLVRCNNFLNICAYLKSMADERRILLPIDPSSAFAELHRMGMPGEENDGFSYKNFCKYYKK